MSTPKTKKNWLFWGGICVGLILTLAGICSIWWRLTGYTDGRLILCSGLGIILGAFGSTATIKYKGITITGVAAIVIALLYVVATLTGSQATFGKITGDIKGAQINVEGDQNYLGAMRDHCYEFVVPGSELRSQTFAVYVYYPPDEYGLGEQEINLEGIDKKHIESVLGSGSHIEWRFDRTTQSLLETVNGNEIHRARLPTPGLSAIPSTGRRGWSLTNEALAQQILPSLEETLEDLGSGIPSERRAARSELASRGPNVVDTMMTVLKEHGSAYRIRLGILFALDQMLHDDTSLAQEISIHLSREDLEIITGALNDTDRTIQIHASRFLHNLGDPRIIEPAFSLVRDSLSRRAAIDLSNFVIEGAFRNLSPAETRVINDRFRGIIDSLKQPLRLNVSALPSAVSPGQMSTITVIVYDVAGQAVSGAQVVISAGGGKFLPRAGASYNPAKRLHGPYSVTAVTNTRGEFMTWWVCNPCAPGYYISVEASKGGYLDAKGEIIVNVH